MNSAIDFPSKSALIVFAKAPVPGQVKTRLTPPLSREEAAGLYEAFLGDAIEAYSGADAFGQGETVAVRLYIAGAEALPDGLVPANVSTHKQIGDGLGPRMHRAFLETFVAGFERIVVIGTDHPTLPLDFVGEAFRALVDPFSVVLGPSDDGGYYLLGLNELYRSLFEIEFSHSAVFKNTLACILAEGARPVVLPAWYDVDDEDSLRRLLQERHSGVPVGPRTEPALKALLEAYPKLL